MAMFWLAHEIWDGAASTVRTCSTRVLSSNELVRPPRVCHRWISYFDFSIRFFLFFLPSPNSKAIFFHHILWDASIPSLYCSHVCEKLILACFLQSSNTGAVHLCGYWTVLFIWTFKIKYTHLNNINTHNCLLK